jgi:hypothetical protein
VRQQIGSVLVHAIRAGALELLAPVAAGQDANAQGARTPSSQEIPDAVAHHDAVLDRDAEPLRRGEEEIRIGLGPRDQVACDDRDVVRDVEELDRRARRLSVAARRDRPRGAAVRQGPEQLDRARQRPDL